MKTALSLGLALALIGSAHAQVFRPRAGERGGRDHARVESSRSHGGDRNHSWRGGDSHGRHDGGGRYHFGGHNHHHYAPYNRGSYVRWHVPFYYDYPGYSTYPSYSYYGGYGAGYPYYGSIGYDGYGSGSRAANGLLLGALAGGIIGNNSGTFRHDAWRGAAWGAGVGWLLGAITDSNRRVAAPAPQYVVPQPVASAQVQPPAAQPAPQQVTVINNYYQASTPMSGANALFGRN